MYIRCRGEWGGTLHLPDGGGMAEQAAWTMDAFTILGGVAAEMREKKG